MRVRHPALPHVNTVDVVEFYGDPGPGSVALYRNIVVFGDAQCDRTPCGTGGCAKLACMHARGEIAAGGVWNIRVPFWSKVLWICPREVLLGNMDGAERTGK